MTGPARLRDTFTARRNRNIVRVAPPRWLVVAGRSVLWALVGLLVALGAVTLYGTVAGSGPAPATPGERFPAAAAEGFAARFAAAYLAGDVEATAGWLAGETTVQIIGGAEPKAVQPAGIEILDDRRATVTVAARLTDGWVHLAVPVYADQAGGLAVAGSPTLVPPPARAADVPAAGLSATSSQLAGDLEEPLAAFFRAYADSARAELARFSTDRLDVAGLNGAVAFDRLVAVEAAYRGQDPDTATADATVRWTTPAGAELTQTYRLQLTRADGEWFVDGLGPQHPNTDSKE